MCGEELLITKCFVLNFQLIFSLFVVIAMEFEEQTLEPVLSCVTCRKYSITTNHRNVCPGEI